LKEDEEPQFWQRRYYDFNVHSEDKRIEKLHYMHCNPVKRGLVEKPEEWAWSSFRHCATGETGPSKSSPYGRRTGGRQWRSGRCGSHPSHNHPTDEDLSVGTPVYAKDGAPRVLWRGRGGLGKGGAFPPFAKCAKDGAPRVLWRGRGGLGKGGAFPPFAKSAKDGAPIFLPIRRFPVPTKQ
jgi:hypothetical protein